MPDYRIYTLNSDGHITGPPQIIVCATDQAAIGQARQLLNDTDHEYEVWEGLRLVTRITFLE
jgi:hypothetical protein